MLSIVLHDRMETSIFHGLFPLGNRNYDRGGRESGENNNINTVRKVEEAKRQTAGLIWHSS